MKKILSLIICICLVVWTCIAAGAKNIDELEAQQAELEKKSKEYESVLAEKNAAVDEQQDYVDALVGKVQTVNEEIQLSHEKISALDDEISGKQKEIDQANDDIEKNMNILKQRIKTIYIAGDVSSLEIILGAKDFSDFLDKVQLVKSVSTHDEELIEEIQTQLDSISEEKEALQEDKYELEEEEKNLQEKQDELNDLLDENKETLANLQEASDEASMQLELTEEELSGLSSEIQEYYRAQKEAAQKASSQASQSSSSESSSSSSSSSSSTSAPKVDVPSNGGYVWPCPGYYYLSSKFEEWRGSYNHGALDIAGGSIMGAPVVAAASGTVISTCSSCTHSWCSCGGGYGNYVWILHGNGKESIYAHLSGLCVSTGSSVSAGQVIGYVGSTGHSTGPHLHFECRYNGAKYDPMSEF